MALIQQSFLEDSFASKTTKASNGESVWDKLRRVSGKKAV